MKEIFVDLIRSLMCIISHLDNLGCVSERFFLVEN